MPYIDVVFEEEMPSIPQVIVSSEFLFPFTPCAHGAMDAIDHRVNSLTTKGFRLYGEPVLRQQQFLHAGLNQLQVVQ